MHAKLGPTRVAKLYFFSGSRLITPMLLHSLPSGALSASSQRGLPSCANECKVEKWKAIPAQWECCPERERAESVPGSANLRVRFDLLPPSVQGLLYVPILKE